MNEMIVYREVDYSLQGNGCQSTGTEMAVYRDRDVSQQGNRCQSTGKGNVRHRMNKLETRNNNNLLLLDELWHFQC